MNVCLVIQISLRADFGEKVVKIHASIGLAALDIQRDISNIKVV